MKKTVALLIALLLTITSFTAASAAESDAGTNGASVQVDLTIGKPEVIVNGETIAVKAPVVANGTTLVPLRVITAAFDAELQWIEETQGIELTYGDTKIELNIGSTAATVNGERRTIPGAPQLLDGTTMVPVRFISETFGATVSFEESLSGIRIKGQKLGAAASTGGSSFDSDEGKTVIGDSHWGWSMMYPTGLMVDFQSLNGDWVTFADANGEYTLDVSVDPEASNVRESNLVDHLADTVYDTITDQRLVKDGGAAYAVVKSRSSDGVYTEDRAYLKSGTVYYVTFQVLKEEDYKNPAKSAVYNALINSFRLSFDKSDAAAKDISKVEKGFVRYENDLYGISMKVPLTWDMHEGSEGLLFMSFEDEESMSFEMSTLEAGDTLDAWVDRHGERFKQTFLEKYREMKTPAERTVAGARALVAEQSSTFGSYWMETYDLFVIKGEYKYNFSFMYERDRSPNFKETIERVVDSIVIDETIASENFGFLEDEYSADMWETEKFENEEFGYSISVPAFWEEGYMFGDDIMHFEYQGGSMMIAAERDADMSDATSDFEDMIEMYRETDDTIRIEEQETTKIGGVTAEKYVYSAEDEEGDKGYLTIYFFERNNILYAITLELYEATQTPENVQRMEDALASFAFE